MNLLSGIYVLPVTEEIGFRYAAIRRTLRPPYGAGLTGDADSLIAATALEHDLTLITTDRHFTRVPELEVMLLDRWTFSRL